MVERLLCKQDVSGSSPLTSILTNPLRDARRSKTPDQEGDRDEQVRAEEFSLQPFPKMGWVDAEFSCLR